MREDLTVVRKDVTDEKLREARGAILAHRVGAFEWVAPDADRIGERATHLRQKRARLQLVVAQPL